MSDFPPIDKISEEQLPHALKDPYWRLCNLYKILDKEGGTVLFKPNAVQAELVEEIWYRNVIPKARQRGFSTLVQLMILDACLFVQNTSGAVIAQDADTAKEIRDKKIKFAYDNLPDAIRAMIPLVTDNVTELKWANGSSLVVAMSVRGRTLQWLHVSEYGKICAKTPERAKEIMSGSLPTVDKTGIIVIESTAEGKEGDFYDKVMTAKALKDAGKDLTELDYKLHFASWWDADEYELNPEGITISPDDARYFDEAEAKIGITLTPPKRAWYVKKRDSDFSGDNEMMRSQYPMFLEEAFEGSVDGLYLSNQLMLARREKRITTVPYDPAYPVNTFWDLGIDDDIAIWFHQQVGPRDHFIDYMEGSGEPYAYFTKQIFAKPYSYGHHYLPHDAAHRRPGAEEIKTIEDMLRELHLRDILIVSRAPDLVAAINMLRASFSTFWFDETNCAAGIRHLDNYKKAWNEKQQVWSSRPADNGHQHAADALRQRAQIPGPITFGSSIRPKRRNRGGMAV